MRLRKIKRITDYLHLILTFISKRKKPSIGASLFLCFILCCICAFFGSYIILPTSKVSIPEWVRTKEYPPYEPVLHGDFPTGSESKPRIPHILHQAWQDNYIPVTYASNIRSFLDHNNDWEYRFWTEKTATDLIDKRHPSLQDSFEHYRTFKAKSEILRYVVLYEFGGVFADTSIKCLRPLKKLTLKYACVFTTVPFEVYSIQDKMPYALYHDLIFCRAKHPFLKQIIENAPFFQLMLSRRDTTGPPFLTNQFMVYNQQKYYHTSRRIGYNETTSSTSPYFYDSRLPELHEDAVYIPNSKYFSFDLQWLNALCRNFEKLSFTQIRGCLELKKRKTDVNIFSFTHSDMNLPFYRPVTNFLFRVEISQLAGIE